MKRHFCTYFDSGYLARGLALYQSLRRHAGDFVLFVLCLDDATFDYLADLHRSDLHPIALNEFESGDEALLRAKRNRTLIEYYFTCTGSLVQFLLRKWPRIDMLTYLDADLYFYSDPSPIFAELGDKSILIVEHRYPDHLEHLVKWGVHNVGLIAFRNNAIGHCCLQWYRERCLEWCYDRYEDGKFADQKYLDDWPARFDEVVVLQHKGAGLSPWNVDRYKIRQSALTVIIDDAPLIFFHFHKLMMLHPLLFEPRLHEYESGLNRPLTQGVYGPYVIELRKIMRQLKRSCHSIRDPRRHTGSELRRILLYGETIVVVGHFAFRFNLEPLLRPLLRMRRLLSSFTDSRSPA